IHPAALAQYLQCGFSTGRSTLLAGVERVKPGELVVVDAVGSIVRRQYWSLLDSGRERTSYGDAAERFDRLMGDVIADSASDPHTALLVTGDAASALTLALA